MRKGGTIAWMAVAVMVLVGAVLFAMRQGPEVVPEPQVPWHDPLVERDLDDIAADTLRVLVLRDPLSWEERPKAVSGLEFELLQRFARKHALVLQAIPMDHPDSMLMALQQGHGDIIAAQWSPRRDRQEWVQFTLPYRSVMPSLAVLRGDPLLERADAGAAKVDQAVDTVWISCWSPFADPDYRFEGSVVGVLRQHTDTMLTPEDLLMEVVLGRHSATIVTNARAAHEAGRLPVLEFSPLPGGGRSLAFAVRRNAPKLLASLDEWLADAKEVEAREHFIAAYEGRMPKAGPLQNRKKIPMDGDSISPFDAHFRRHALDMPWDWELLAAMAFRESRFDSTVTSRMGAMGIMQLMPRTAAKLGVDSALGMQDHIRAATRYLNKLDTMWMRAVPEREQRLRFVLASYNAGPGHIIDAQRLAEQLGLDPGRWEHNVERAVLLKAKPRYYMQEGMRNGYCNGSQVFTYVRDVLALQRQLKGRPRVDNRLVQSAPVDSASW